MAGYCSAYGSVIPRALPWAIFGCAEGVLLKWTANHFEDFVAFNYWQQGGAWYHPYAFHVFGMLLGFALVMRIQIAYQRFWEGTTQCHLACSKWGDAIMQVMAFDEISKDAFSEEALEFRMLMLHYVSLMNACALVDVRRDDDLDCPLTLNREDPYMWKPNANAALLDQSIGGKQEGESAEAAHKPEKAKVHRSHRMHTTPLQMVIQTRRSLMSQLSETDINSFAAVEADTEARPQSYASTAADMRCRVRKNTISAASGAGLFSNDKGHACVGTSSASDVSKAKLRRGSLTQSDFMTASIFLRARPSNNGHRAACALPRLACACVSDRWEWEAPAPPRARQPV